MYRLSSKNGQNLHRNHLMHVRWSQLGKQQTPGCRLGEPCSIGLGCGQPVPQQPVLLATLACLPQDPAEQCDVMQIVIGIEDVSNTLDGRVRLRGT